MVTTFTVMLLRVGVLLTVGAPLTAAPSVLNNCAVDVQSPVPLGIVASRTGLHEWNLMSVGMVVGVGNDGIVAPISTQVLIAVMSPDVGA